jgi:glutathione S-transferase
MEARLQREDFLAGNDCSLGDISLYAYTHLAHEGGFDLSAYPAIEAWISRIQALDGYLAMDP